MKIQRFNENKEEPKRFSFSCVGYGVFDLMSEKYHMGRIEMYDGESNSSYATDEFFYCVPYDMADKFEDFYEDLQTDLPFHVDFWKMDDCKSACAESLGITVEQMEDKTFSKKFAQDKYKKENP